MAKEYASTKLIPEVKAKLLNRLGNLSISDYIDQMMTFFDVTGAKPSDFQTHPTIQLKKDIERIISIQKAQEKGIFGQILTILQDLKKGVDISPVSQTVPAGDGQQEITEEMIIAVSAENDRLQTDLQHEKDTTVKLNEKIRKLEQEIGQAKVDGGSQNGEAADLFVWLKNNTKKSTFGNDDWIIPGSVMKGFTERMEKLLK
jgi:hypothetical protein